MQKMLVSSAYALIWTVGIERRRLKKGSIERLKRRGEKGSPWGTPWWIGNWEPIRLLIFNDRDLLWYDVWARLMKEGGKREEVRTWSSQLWETLS